MYPEHLTTPMKLELTDNGFADLTSATEVEETIAKAGTTLLVINSVCGCAAGTCRPGVLQSLQQSEVKPTQLATVFAGVDAEAVAKARELMLPYPPSSPSIAMFKDGELVHFIERHHIEGRSAEMIAEHLTAVYKEFC
ncbi:BrxA/BrxB family bacilliredoxin [Flammeovirga yaeyamensis]|uniref:BrxA/BrxB family bacilliredoxin n=1 Tax=Flammeovirga yaeyamensis TaxID=367791 RepID=A0AAX1N2C1_9BACT|nr:MULTISPECIES: BrxA/BrxB family bacilliredoxin [Flammeovirga]ANQ50900.1 BrxA/BrxB family bacilliredoxin [Flammeovirga sp. MY04]MBB3701225.1 putative YphP/YqiW family bacilliredoxin [Flammeovirga yaeyamensis]NMF38449.1 BrxA/BrxB family bacilliredoxin [Flammeovirga yaeyamensis]QWG01690.1 BrxA/BrxB family bacilliredoxin [Flammeovirga yaeyamensis]